jgi:hypothetical protein
MCLFTPYTMQSYSSSSWLSLLETEADTWMGILVEEEVGRALRRSDLDKLLELVVCNMYRNNRHNYTPYTPYTPPYTE